MKQKVKASKTGYVSEETQTEKSKLERVVKKQVGNRETGHEARCMQYLIWMEWRQRPQVAAVNWFWLHKGM